MNPFRLLITRKISSSLVLRAGLNGIDVLEKEFIAIEPAVTTDVNKSIEKILSTEATIAFTSKNAVIAVGSHYDVKNVPWKIFSLEGSTGKEVRKFFSEDKIAGTALNAKLLAKVILESSAGKKVVFFCGNLRRDDLPELLRSKNIAVDEIVVYNTVLVPQKVVDDYEAIAFFSPSAVKSFFTLNQLKDTVICISVGQTTTEAIKELSKNRIVTANKPSEESVLDLAKEIKNNT